MTTANIIHHRLHLWQNSDHCLTAKQVSSDIWKAGKSRYILRCIVLYMYTIITNALWWSIESDSYFYGIWMLMMSWVDKNGWFQTISKHLLTPYDVYYIAIPRIKFFQRLKSVRLPKLSLSKFSYSMNLIKVSLIFLTLLCQSLYSIWSLNIRCSEMIRISAIYHSF